MTRRGMEPTHSGPTQNAAESRGASAAREHLSSEDAWGTDEMGVVREGWPKRGYPTWCGWCLDIVYAPESWGAHAYGRCIDPAGAAKREQDADRLITRAKT